MSQLERVFSIDRLLRRRVPPSRNELLRRLEVSPATLKRDLEFMRDRLRAPIRWDRERRGYCYGKPEGDHPEFELPGLWFSSEEIHALLLLREVIRQLQPGFLAERLKPFERRLEELAAGSQGDTQRIVFRANPFRAVNTEFFERVATATLKRRRLEIVYFGRHRNAGSERTVSPQRLVYYRGAWYLDAWCHARNDWRRFALDSLRAVEALPMRAIDADSEGQVDAYGIYTAESHELLYCSSMPKRPGGSGTKNGICSRSARPLQTGPWFSECHLGIPRNWSWTFCAMGVMWRSWNLQI